jgi:hypothetical protein
MTDAEALTIVKTMVAADPDLDLICRFYWEVIAHKIRQYEPPMRDQEQRVKQKQYRARQAYMLRLAAGDMPEVAGALALQEIEVWVAF